jgi:hypothetical protein
MSEVPTVGWSRSQPGRGFFGAIICILLSFFLCKLFTWDNFNGVVGMYSMSMVPVAGIIGMVWGAKYPQVERLPQAWRGLLLTFFTFFLGSIAFYVLLYFWSAGVVQPFSVISLIVTICVTFFLIIAWGCWPWNNASLPIKGLLTLITAYLLGWGVSFLFNFDTLVIPGVGTIPFYDTGGPFEAFAAIAPSGAVQWQHAITYAFASVIILFTFALIGMWPFYKVPGLMKQPVMGIVLTVVCLGLGYVLYFIGVQWMGIEPIRWMIDIICYAFGLLMIMVMFETWPGRMFPAPWGGFLNIILAVGIGIIGWYLFNWYLSWVFGTAAMSVASYPNNLFGIGQGMLGFTFPLWVIYHDQWDYWPLPPSPPPPGA